MLPIVKIPPTCMLAFSKLLQSDHIRIISTCSWFALFNPVSRCLLEADGYQEMLSSYSDVKSRPCQKCNQLLDFNAQFPVVRVRDMATNSKRDDLFQFRALHHGCQIG